MLHAPEWGRLQALLDDGIEVPAYSLSTVGDSLLALRRPADGCRSGRGAGACPRRLQRRLLLAYAWLEQEPSTVAMPDVRALPDGQEAWPRRAGARSATKLGPLLGRRQLAMRHSFAHEQRSRRRQLGRAGHDRSAQRRPAGGIAAGRARAYCAPPGPRALRHVTDARPGAARCSRRTRRYADGADRRMDEAAPRSTTCASAIRHPRLVRDHRSRGPSAWLAGASRGIAGPSTQREGGTSQSPLGSRDGVGCACSSKLRCSTTAGAWRVAEEAWPTSRPARALPAARLGPAIATTGWAVGVRAARRR